MKVGDGFVEQKGRIGEKSPCLWWVKTRQVFLSSSIISNGPPASAPCLRRATLSESCHWECIQPRSFPSCGCFRLDIEQAVECTLTLLSLNVLSSRAPPPLVSIAFQLRHPGRVWHGEQLQGAWIIPLHASSKGKTLKTNRVSILQTSRSPSLCLLVLSLNCY